MYSIIGPRSPHCTALLSPGFLGEAPPDKAERELEVSNAHPPRPVSNTVRPFKFGGLCGLRFGVYVLLVEKMSMLCSGFGISGVHRL